MINIFRHREGQLSFGKHSKWFAIFAHVLVAAEHPFFHAQEPFEFALANVEVILHYDPLQVSLLAPLLYAFGCHD